MPNLKQSTASLWTSAFVVAILASSPCRGAEGSNPDGDFRPPAVPLVACDPYFSIWSQADTLQEVETTHWTGKPHRMSSLVRIDGQTHRLMGGTPDDVPAMQQTSVEVLPTRTIYQFSGSGVAITLTFMTPALPADLMMLSRPVTYLTYDVKATDDQTHQVEIYFDARGELASDLPMQPVEGEVVASEQSKSLKIGTVSQQVLGKRGDDLRIDWGYLYIAANKSSDAGLRFGSPKAVRDQFIESGELNDDPVDWPQQAGDVVGAVTLDLGKVDQDGASEYLVLAYDDLYSIEYMQHKLRPYWRKDGWDAADLIDRSVEDYASIRTDCQRFDDQLMNDLKAAGGQEYAEIAALAYRQCFAAGKFVADANGQPLQFCKENHSNGCIATSDVFYPMAPQFLLFGPTLTKSVLVPFMEYAASDRWTFPFAPHDLGTYPKANGQVYGGGERSAENQMPVEESGNMLILFGALAKMEGNADFAAKYWDQLSQWADYLRQKGFDPENQLCTDDFAGHMAHNVNLSAKAICGLGSYAMLCEMRGMNDQADRYRRVAAEYADKWMSAAKDGDHYRLAFDRPGTWSQKYNLVWDRLLNLNLFDESVYQTEMAYYRKVQNRFGLPLDNRSDYTKLDWVLWTATLTEDQEDFSALVHPVHRFLNQTPDRSPMTDWYFTSTAKKRGFTARPVVGGVFLKMLYDDSVWTSYANADRTEASGWAPMPIPPKVETLVPTSADANIAWSYTTELPAGNWYATDYDAGEWKSGSGGFGTPNTPGAVVGTRWDGRDIWIRRTFSLQSLPQQRVGLRLHHDEAAEVYLNGQRVAQLFGWSTEYELVEIPAEVLREGENVLAIHCHQTGGGQYIDCGLDTIVPVDAGSGESE
ncbi:DUF4965 domain-containing protein [Roseiconus nitratireducens]|uniref:DUF4965 domain-containing protein n=2 Tax=Roseiconus nitratireducens TaxID=2605748 RepID=A0A5M6CTF9_9BACT|nr:DUF4965 domain-containing protein [Roseiconus nitratireducens]